MEEINQYLTFLMNGECYAISVSHIKEVLEVPRVTRIPRMPPFMRGVINLRGSVVPILDLRLKFAMGETPLTSSTAIIVAEIPSGDKAECLCVGIFADAVQKVLTIEPGEIEPPPKIGLSVDTAFIQGMGHVEDRFLVILAIKELLTDKDRELLDAAGANTEETEKIAK